MKKTELTIIKQYEIDGNGCACGDEFDNIVAVGFDYINAKREAIDALKYACCSDFSSPVYCKKGYCVEFFKAYGIENDNNYDEDEIAEAQEWEYAIKFTFNGVEYFLPNDYNEYFIGSSLTSNDIREFETWEESEAVSVKEARNAIGLSQQALSDWLEIPKRTIEDWDTGKRKCPDWCRKLIVEKIFTHK